MIRAMPRPWQATPQGTLIPLFSVADAPARREETLGEKVSGGCRAVGETFPWRPPPAPARRARGTGRAGKLPRGPFAGLLDTDIPCGPLRSPRSRASRVNCFGKVSSLARQGPVAERPMSDPDDECIVDRGRVLRPSRKTGETSPQQFTRGRASAKRFTRRRRGCPFPPASGLPIHRNLPAPPLALGDCGASARALGGLPGGEEETLRVPSSRTAAKRRGAPRTEAAAAIEEGGEGKGAAGGASPEGVRADARARGIGHPLCLDA